MDNKDYITLWTDWQKQEEFIEVVNAIKKYLERDKWYKKSEEGPKINEDLLKEKYERQGIQVYTNNHGQSITFCRSQNIVNSLSLEFCVELHISENPSNKDLDKLAQEVLALHQLLKEKKE